MPRVRRRAECGGPHPSRRPAARPLRGPAGPDCPAAPPSGRPSRRPTAAPGTGARAARDAGLRGASFLGLSPVHALFESDRTKISPYSPSSRLFLETLFIEPGALPGFAGSRAEAMLAKARTRVDALRDAALVDHAGIWEVLSPVLRAYWEDSDARSGADAAFDAFREAGGEDLRSHATFEALSAHFKAEGAHWLGDWPEEYRRAGTQAVSAFAEEHAEEVAYHAFLQFLADRQLAQAAEAALDSGMRLGLYRDLAVGADRGGSEVWSHPERFAGHVSIGAPPDLLAPKGQDWGLPAFDPLAMERDGLAAFRADPRWRTLAPTEVRPWTDDYVNLFGALIRSMSGRG